MSWNIVACAFFIKGINNNYCNSNFIYILLMYNAWLI